MTFHFEKKIKLGLYLIPKTNIRWIRDLKYVNELSWSEPPRHSALVLLKAHGRVLPIITMNYVVLQNKRSMFFEPGISPIELLACRCKDTGMDIYSISSGKSGNKRPSPSKWFYKSWYTIQLFKNEMQTWKDNIY